MTFTIEKATFEDLSALHTIEKESFGEEAYSRNQLALLLLNPFTIRLKAQKDNKTVGFTIGSIEPTPQARIGHIITIEVTTEYRRAGIGFRLLEELEETFSKRAVESVYLEVRADNTAAIELYHKGGYQEFQALKGYYPRGALGFRMKKQLSNPKFIPSTAT